mgnify:FL=1
MIGAAIVLVGATYAQAKSKPPQDVISIDVARKMATDSMPGQVQKEQLEQEHGQWVYSFDLKSVSDSKTHEVQVDARSGKLVSTKAESDDEATEHDDEENEAE